MDQPMDRYRLAIAALSAPDKIRDAVEELGANRFSGRDLCLAGGPAAIDAIRSTGPFAPDHLFTPLLEVEPVPLVAGEPMLATSGRPLTTLKRSLSIERPTAACWLGPMSRAPLVERMTSGDVLLMAGPLTAAQLMVATRVLLRHSIHPVQSHLLAPSLWQGRQE